MNNFSTNFKSPCKDCNTRHRACHDSCEAYQKCKAEWKARGETYKKWSELEEYAAKISIKAYDQARRKHKK